MPEARRLLSITREWPWGLALVTDPASSSHIPDRLDTSGVGAGRNVVVVGIQHAVDGDAVAEVWLGSPDLDLTCIYDDDFLTVTGVVVLGDAADEHPARAEIGEGQHRLRVLVDHVGSPELVAFAFTPAPDMPS